MDGKDQQSILTNQESTNSRSGFTKPKGGFTFVLQTDTSGLGIGAILSQQDLPIAYYSRKLLPRERRYSGV